MHEKLQLTFNPTVGQIKSSQFDLLSQVKRQTLSLDSGLAALGFL